MQKKQSTAIPFSWEKFALDTNEEIFSTKKKRNLNSDFYFFLIKASIRKSKKKKRVFEKKQEALH